MDFSEYISVDPHACGGKPFFKGTQVTVQQVLELLEAGVSVDDLISEKHFPQLTRRHVCAALDYAAKLLESPE